MKTSPASQFKKPNGELLIHRQPLSEALSLAPIQNMLPEYDIERAVMKKYFLLN